MINNDVRTMGDWLKYLPPDLSFRFIYNYTPDLNLFYDDVLSFEQFLNLLYWEGTVEGQEYWHKMCYRNYRPETLYIEHV